jgi:hypothetical protein
MHIHFKPSNRKTCLNTTLFLIDIIFAIAFQIGHMYFFINASFKKENDHMLHVIIGAGFTGFMLIYAFSDGVRFLRK